LLERIFTSLHHVVVIVVYLCFTSLGQVIKFDYTIFLIINTYTNPLSGCSTWCRHGFRHEFRNSSCGAS